MPKKNNANPENVRYLFQALGTMQNSLQQLSEQLNQMQEFAKVMFPEGYEKYCEKESANDEGHPQTDKGKE